MVQIEIDDEVWEVWARSWALYGTRTKEQLVRMLEVQMWEESLNVLEAGEHQLISDAPEAYIQRQIGILKEEEKRKKRLNR